MQLSNSMLKHYASYLNNCPVIMYFNLETPNVPGNQKSHHSWIPTQIVPADDQELSLILSCQYPQDLHLQHS